MIEPPSPSRTENPPSSGSPRYQVTSPVVVQGPGRSKSSENTLARAIGLEDRSSPHAGTPARGSSAQGGTCAQPGLVNHRPNQAVAASPAAPPMLMPLLPCRRRLQFRGATVHFPSDNRPQGHCTRRCRFLWWPEPIEKRRTVKEIKCVGVIGAGQMGNGIAHVFALAGFDVALHDVSEEALDAAPGIIRGNLDRQIHRGKITAGRPRRRPRPHPRSSATSRRSAGATSSSRRRPRRSR